MSVPFYNLLFNLSLDHRSEEPLYIQVAARVAEVIRAGKLQPGAPMPGTRTLAKALCISRNAAIAAYGELHSQGWIHTEVGLGTRVATSPPDFQARSAPAPSPQSSCGFEFTSTWEGVAPRSDVRLDLRDPGPDPRILPVEELARAFKRPVSRSFGRRIRQADPFGPLDTREALAEFLMERRALQVDASALLMTGGAQEALGLMARNLFPSGACVAVEDPGNPKVWATLQQAGLDLVPVPVDEEGIRPEALEDVCIGRQPRALYLTPNCQYPTGAILSPERRTAVLELAGRYRMAILEDDHASELFYEERDWRPLATEDRRGVVIYLCGFERILGPAFGLGCITGPKSVVEFLCRSRAEEGGAELSLLSGVLRDMLLDGSLLRHIRKARTAYRFRRDLACASLQGLAGGNLVFSPPAAGLGLWIRSAPDDLEAFRQGAENLGLAFRPPQHWCLSSEGSPGWLFPFGMLDDAELRNVLALLKRVGGLTAVRA